MAKSALTDVAIRQSKPVAGRQIELWDSVISGLGVRISPQGTRSFVLIYRSNGKSRRMTLGRYPGLTLADARMLASQSLKDVASGRDPQHVKEERALAAAASGFASLLTEFVETHCKRHNRPSTARETERILRSDFEKPWKSRDIKTIARMDILRLLDDLVDNGSPSAANHAFAAIRKFFNWSVERGYVAVSPCNGLSMPTKPGKRDRVLSEAELRDVWTGARDLGYPAGPIIQLLILTGQRRGEVAGMRWADIDLNAKTWTIPKEMTKNGKPHTVPILTMAEAILSTLPQKSHYVFPARSSDGCFNGFNKAKKRLDERQDFPAWTLHDLRRTAATGMAGLGVAPHIVERLLNHVSGTFAGVAGVYNRFQYADEVRAALEAWEQRLKALV